MNKKGMRDKALKEDARAYFARLLESSAKGAARRRALRQDPRFPNKVSY